MSKTVSDAVDADVEALPDHDAKDGAVVKRTRKKPATRTSFDPLGDQENLTRYAIVYGSDNIWDICLGIAMKPVALRLAIGRQAFKEWESNPGKLVVQPSQIVFDPTETCSPDCINLFTGLPLVPAEGCCADLLHLLYHLISESADTDQGVNEVLNFVLDWLAYPLQHPGAKMATALVFHGPQGTGKNLFFEAYARIFGEYAAVIGEVAPQI